MHFLGWIAGCLWDLVCGWVGHHAVKLLTLGRVRLDYGATSEGVIAESIGAGVLLVLAWGGFAVLRSVTG